MRKQLQELLEKRVQQCVSSSRHNLHAYEKISRKKEALSKRNGEIIKVKAKGHIEDIIATKEVDKVIYNIHFQYLIQQKRQLYLEEEVEIRKAEFYKGMLVEDVEIDLFHSKDEQETVTFIDDGSEAIMERNSFRYNRLKAVQYAERWWNDYNPAYKKFAVDCTNYISQCLYAGGAPMRGYPNRSKGWWMRNNNWSYSWSVANSLRWYLPGAKVGLRAKEVTSPDQLLLGDVICYDFQGDGRFDHNTMVTGRDALGMPLVNAHTTNSRMRYWAYEDSTAYTPNIKYKFFTIMDDD